MNVGDRVYIRSERANERALYDGPATVELVSETIPNRYPFVLVYLDNRHQRIWVKASEMKPLEEEA